LDHFYISQFQRFVYQLLHFVISDFDYIHALMTKTIIFNLAIKNDSTLIYL